jgi:hypothetical protein
MLQAASHSEGVRVAKDAHDARIMPAMLLPPFIVKAILATLLPLCFTWGFVACMYFCSDIGARTDARHAYSEAKHLEASPHGDYCPIPARVASLPSERQSLPNARQNDGEARAPFAVVPLSTTYNAHFAWQRSVPLSTSDPPLEWFCVFRI